MARAFPSLHGERFINSAINQRKLSNKATQSWSNTIGGGFTKDGLQQWSLLTDFGKHTIGGPEQRRRIRQLHDDPELLPYVDLFSQRVSRECVDILACHDSPTCVLGRSFFGSNNFLPEKCILTTLNSVVSLYPTEATSLPLTFELNRNYLMWTVAMKAPLELICSWEVSRWGVRGCTMVAFDPTLGNVYHGNCIDVPMERLNNLAFRSGINLHVTYAKFLLDGMVNQLEKVNGTRIGVEFDKSKI